MDEKHEYEPPIHIIPDGEKWGVCLSRLGKWVAGIAAGLVTLGFGSMIGLEINNAVELGRHGEKIEALSRRVDAAEGDTKRRLDRLEGWAVGGTQ